MAEIDENFEQIIAELEAQEKGEKAVVKKEEVKEEVKTEEVKTNSTELEYPHKQILEEEGLTKGDLPSDIRTMITTFDRKMLMAKRRKAPESTMLKIQNLSTLIADKIITYLESEDVSHETIVVKKEDGGGIDDGGLDEGGLDDGMDDGAADDDGGIDDLGGGNGDVEDGFDDLEGGGEASGGEAEKGSMFDGVLGGIFNWNS